MIKKGSLVKCIDGIFDMSKRTVEKFPQTGCYYIIRDVVVSGSEVIGYRLEEIINPELPYPSKKGDVVLECFFTKSKFVEIHVEVDIKKLLKESFGRKK